MQLDIMLRSMGAGTLLLTAAVLLLSAPRAPVARWFLPFALGIAGFLAVNTAFDAAELPEPLWSAASFFSRMATVFLWLFCLVLFDGRLRDSRAAATVGGLWLALVVIDKGYFAPAPAFDVSAIMIVLGTGLVLHVGWRVMRDFRGDLIEPRRRARPLFTLALLAFVALDFFVDILQGYGWRPPSFLLLQNGVLLALTIGLALWLLRAERWLTVGTPVHAAPSRPAANEAPHPDLAVLGRLEAVMQSQRSYLDPELTFARFAAQVGVPEPVLRRAINHRLGHGHFRNFLNGYRIEEAKRRLRDPASAGDKIVAVALDSGFSSLASFNRAFRLAVGCSPSEYRAGSPVRSARGNQGDGS